MSTRTEKYLLGESLQPTVLPLEQLTTTKRFCDFFFFVLFCCHRSLTSVFLKTREYLNIWSQNINKLVLKKKSQHISDPGTCYSFVLIDGLLMRALIVFFFSFFFPLQHSRNSQFHTTTLAGKTVATSISLILSHFPF